VTCSTGQGWAEESNLGGAYPSWTVQPKKRRRRKKMRKRRKKKRMRRSKKKKNKT
jgi:hypothetical protein